jgi:hypothetical protein
MHHSSTSICTLPHPHRRNTAQIPTRYRTPGSPRCPTNKGRIAHDDTTPTTHTDRRIPRPHPFITKSKPAPVNLPPFERQQPTRPSEGSRLPDRQFRQGPHSVHKSQATGHTGAQRRRCFISGDFVGTKRKGPTEAGPSHSGGSDWLKARSSRRSYCLPQGSHRPS